MGKNIIFDYDGTLHDTMHIYASAFRSTYEWLAANGQAPAREFEDAEISVWVGYNSRAMWEAFMPSLPQCWRERASQNIGRLMLAQLKQRDARLYTGAADTLQQLKERGYRLLFLSNCKEDYMQAHRELFGLERYFDGFYCCETYDYIPKEEIFPVIAADFPGRYMVVGDRFTDIEMAVRHQLLSIGCGYGFGSAKELAAADAIAENVTQIPQLTDELWN